MTVWTLRHPPVDRQGRCIGQTVIETTMSGAEAVKHAMDGAPFRPTRLFSSDLPRCANLAYGLSEAWSISLTLAPELREMNFGQWEGRTYDAIAEEDGPRWHAWCLNWKTHAPPDGESLDTFAARIQGWLDSQTLLPTDAIVTHAGVIRTRRVLAGAPWDEAMASENPFLGWVGHPL